MLTAIDIQNGCILTGDLFAILQALDELQEIHFNTTVRNIAGGIIVTW